MNTTGYTITVSVDEVDDPTTVLELEQTTEDSGTVFLTLFNGNEKTIGTFDVDTLRIALSKFDSPLSF
jgi:hypothetical protein